MPELAEVAYYKNQWMPGEGHPVSAVLTHPATRIYRECDPVRLADALTGKPLRHGLTAGKQIAFVFGRNTWLGIHLGMTGGLLRGEANHTPGKWDHLVINLRGLSLIFKDPRQFGRVRLHEGGEPDWWTAIPTAPHEPEFTRDRLNSILSRHARAPLKAVLLRQDRFPGIGNWMADEICWRAALHPAIPAGTLDARQRSRLFKHLQAVCRDAMAVIAPDWSDPPDSWLFNHRWKDGGRCPKTGVPLIRETIAGRTTCWSPGRQAPPYTSSQ